VELAADNKASFDPAASYADCTASAEKRAPEGSVDMGSGFDCFDSTSHTAARSITPQQRDWRQTLVTAMRRHGLVNYGKEWWHFSLPGVGRGVFDFPITRRDRPE
jgi:D-alanyl-D-alanine dipeptidase